MAGECSTHGRYETYTKFRLGNLKWRENLRGLDIEGSKY
jgi:hypothetical protein